jgi:hypothetical protein
MPALGSPVTWAELTEELDSWAKADRLAEFWWRDDDAIADTEALDDLLRCAGPTPVALAVIPAIAEASLADKLRRNSTVTVLQHGWRHHNHALHGPNSEYPMGRGQNDVAEEFVQGRRRLGELFCAQYIPVFAPPWHGFDDAYLPTLREAGLLAISRKGVRSSAGVAGLRVVNVHCVPIQWSDPPSFGTDEEYLLTLLGHLQGKRTGRYDPDEPTGVLTHHLVQNSRSYAFMTKLSKVIYLHPAAKWLDARSVFGL